MKLLIEEYTKQLCKISLKLTCVAFLIRNQKKFSPKDLNILPFEILQDLERYNLLSAKTRQGIPALHYMFHTKKHHIAKLKCLKVILTIN